MSLPSRLDGQQRTVNVRSIIATMVNAGGRPARSRTHGIPPMQCTATAKGTGERCKNYVLPGSPVCAMHGMTGNGFRKAEERVTLAQLYERTPREHPWEVVLDATHTAVAAALDKLGLTEPWRAYALQVAHRALLGDEAQGDEPQPPDDAVVQECTTSARGTCRPSKRSQHAGTVRRHRPARRCAARRRRAGARGAGDAGHRWLNPCATGCAGERRRRSTPNPSARRARRMLRAATTPTT
jgi:hypothetical protein